MTEKLDAMMFAASKAATDAIRKEGAVTPMAIGHAADGTMVPILGDFPDNEAKAKWVAKTKLLFRSMAVDHYVMMMECWYADSTTNKRMPSERDDRKEGVIIFAADNEGNKTGRMFEIARDGSGKPSLIDAKMNPDGFLGGQFTELLD